MIDHTLKEQSAERERERLQTFGYTIITKIILISYFYDLVPYKA